MSVVPPRQAAFLSVANLDETGAREDKALATEIMNYLRAFAVSHGVNSGHIRQMDERTLLLRLDELPREAFLQAILGMTEDSRNLKTPGNEQVPLKIRVGAMSERAMRSFVNDAAQDMLAYMNHADCASAFLTGDEIDIWRKFESSNIEFISHEQLKYLDPFSGLIKESRFFTLLQHILDDFEHCDPKARVLFFDIEDFKSYNRTFGLERGDELLLHVARTIKGQFPTDVVAHLSIDRFAVVTNSPDVMRKCAIIHEDTKAYHKSFAPEIKCGIFKVDPLVTSAHVALDCAKIACESVKGRYDVSCRIFDGDLRERLFTRRYVARHAEHAVSNQWIRAYAQPVVDTTTGEVCGFEALARWDDPNRGILSPAIFIPTLEEAHLIHKVDAYMVNEVCRHMSEELRSGRAVVPASVNLSRVDFAICDIFEIVRETCDRWHIPHHMLAVEVTEGALDGTANLRQEMDRFRAAGFEVWMDDFGCGYSSLNLLKDYEFDVLKVDMEFLRDMDANARSKTIVASVIEMAKSLGIRTLVEGVETEAQRDFLCDVGADMMQGYLFGRPLPLELRAF